VSSKSNPADITAQFQAFYRAFPYLEIDALIEYFAFFGGGERDLGLDLLAGLESNIRDTVITRFRETEQMISPSYLLDEPYRPLLTAVARGDGKLLNIFRRARLSEAAGGHLLNTLVSLGILRIEASREAKAHRRYGQQLPREIRRYRIQSKARFVHPFHRFWFGFVAPYGEALARGEAEPFWANYHRHRDRALSYLFEQLSNALLIQRFASHDPVLSHGSWWDRRHEYDVLAITRSGRLILGECKYTGRAITKGEWTKLRDKAAQTGLRVDTWALFSRSGFSRELEGMAGEDLLLFGIEDFFQLVVNLSSAP